MDGGSLLYFPLLYCFLLFSSSFPFPFLDSVVFQNPPVDDSTCFNYIIILFSFLNYAPLIALAIAFRSFSRDDILRYPHYGYQHVDMLNAIAQCHACNRSNVTKVVTFLSGTEYNPIRVSHACRN